MHIITYIITTDLITIRLLFNLLNHKMKEPYQDHERLKLYGIIYIYKLSTLETSYLEKEF